LVAVVLVEYSQILSRSTQPNVVKFGSGRNQPNTSKFCPELAEPNFDWDRLDKIWPNSAKFCIGSRQLNQIRLNLD